MQDTLPSSTGDRLASISRFLSRPLVYTLFAFHPNDLGQSLFSPPLEWEGWWHWPGQICDGQHKPEQEDLWLILLKYYESCLSGHEPSDQAPLIPPVLRSLISDACKLALPRDIGQVYPSHGSSSTSNLFHRPLDPKTCSRGMSPKKAHEVAQVAGYLGNLISPGSPMSSIHHVVDIGAGQAYLSRTLRDQLHLHVLGLDWSEVQSQGAARRDASTMARREAQGRRAEADNPVGKQAPRPEQSCHAGVMNGSLTYITTSIDPDSLVSSTKAWLGDIAPSSAGIHTPAQVTPVLFVALHACGSLTPDILRAFISARQSNESVASTSTPWSSQGAVVVGCCYNMMRPEDFPLSRTLRSCSSVSIVKLSPSHLQLAAQVPSQWTRSQQTLKETRIALRKIVWRALLQDTFNMRQKFGREGDAGKRAEGGNATSCGTPLERLGRLNDATYADWETFCNVVRTKLHLQHRDLPPAPSTRSERRIEVFHVLRCILGPVVETFILLDRLAWMSEELEGSPFTPQLVNLFDQASGSGRNIAIAILPNREQPF